MTVDRIEDFQALEPFFRVIEDGLAGLVDGGHFFDLLADTSSSSSSSPFPTILAGSRDATT